MPKALPLPFGEYKVKDFRVGTYPSGIGMPAARSTGSWTNKAKSTCEKTGQVIIIQFFCHKVVILTGNYYQSFSSHKSASTCFWWSASGLSGLSGTDPSAAGSAATSPPSTDSPGVSVGVSLGTLSSVPAFAFFPLALAFAFAFALHLARGFPSAASVSALRFSPRSAAATCEREWCLKAMYILIYVCVHEYHDIQIVCIYIYVTCIFWYQDPRIIFLYSFLDFIVCVYQYEV